MSRTKLLLIGQLGALATCALAPACASANAVWIRGSEEVEPGTRLNVTYKGSGNTILKGTLAGVKVEIVCSEANGEGWIENSPSTAMGLGSALQHYLKCTVPKPAGGNCVVRNELVLLSDHTLLNSSSEEKVSDEFSTETGHSNLTEVAIESCTNSSLNGTYPLEGALVGTANNTTSSLEFTPTSGSSATFGGNTATFTSTVKQEMQGGGALQGIPDPVIPTGNSNFGKVKTGVSKVEKFVLKNPVVNVTFETAFILSDMGPEAFKIKADKCKEKGFIAPGQCEIEVLFMPGEKRKYEALLWVPYETAGGIKLRLVILLIGEGE